MGNVTYYFSILLHNAESGEHHVTTVRLRAGTTLKPGLLW